MLLVDDDQPDVVQRREHRRARAHADPRLAAAQAHPLVVALADAERRVQHGDDVAEAGLEAPQHLRGERDLGHEHDRRAPGLQRRLHRPEIDLGLARAGDALQQEPGMAAARARGAPPPARSSAAACSAVSGGAVAEALPTAWRTGRRGRAGGRSRPGRGTPGAAGPGCRARRRPWGRARQGPEQSALAVVEPGAVVRERRGSRRRQLRDQAPAWRRCPRGAGRQHQLQRARGRGAVLARHPVGQRHQVGAEPGPDHRLGLGQALGVQLGALGQLHHHAERAAAPNGTRSSEPTSTSWPGASR